MIVKPSELGMLVGRQFGPSPWFHIDQQRIDAFASATEDRLSIHVDPERAANSAFGTTIAHGFLTLSLLSYLLSEAAFTVEGAHMTINYGVDNARFLLPVRVGSDIRALRTIAAIELRQPGQYLVTSDVSVEIKGEVRPALLARLLGLVVVAT